MAQSKWMPSVLGLLGMLTTAALSTACLTSGAHAQQTTSKHPNVIVLLTDDQGTVDLGVMGSDVTTPNLDRLANSGTRFTHFYSGAPVCSPSRACLLTGRYPIRAGLMGNAGGFKGSHGLPGEQTTIAETFKAAGYATAHIGKWHLGFTDEEDPLGQGFDHSFGHMQGCIDNYSHFFYWAGPNHHDLWRNRQEIHAPGQFFPDLMLNEAKTFITQNEAKGEQPFFIYYAINAPHYPYQGEPKWLEHYKDTPLPRRLYAAFLSSTDERIGQLLDFLETQGLTEDTIIVFQSDHGHSVETRAFNGGGDNGPFRGNKFTLFEGGIRVPAAITWPGHIPSGVVSEQTAHGADWLPTVAKLANIPLVEKDIDGKPLALMPNDPKPETPRVLHWQETRGDKPEWAIQRWPYKLLANSDRPKDAPELTEADLTRMLVNLEDDPAETKNLIHELPEIAAELEALHNAWYQQADPRKQ